MVYSISGRFNRRVFYWVVRPLLYRERSFFTIKNMVTRITTSMTSKTRYFIYVSSSFSTEATPRLLGSVGREKTLKEEPTATPRYKYVATIKDKICPSILCNRSIFEKNEKNFL